MSSTTHPARTAVAALLVVVLGTSLLAGVAVAGAEPTLRVADAELTAGGTATVDVVLTSVPEGLAGYALAVRVDGETAAFTNATYPGTFGLTSEPDVAADGSRVTLEAADIGEQVEPGAADVRLATVELRGLSSGQAQLSVEPLQIDTDEGDRMAPQRRTGTVTVTADADTPAESAASAAEVGTDASPATETLSESDGDDADSVSATPAGGADSSIGGLGVGATLLAASLAVVLVAVVLVRRRGWGRGRGREREQKRE